MLQILQSLKTGETALAEVPAPAARRGHVVVRTHASVVSVGTERMLVDFGQASLIDKARQQPDKVKQVLQKARTDGLIPTIEAVQSKLDAEVPLGYCNAGEVIAVGEGVPDLRVGDRVVSNGPHAELVRVPHRLTARIPDGLSYETAAWTVLGSIGLQGVRLAAPTLGESVVVLGLGPIGLLCVQLLRASGCRVLGLDLSAERCALAEQFGAAVLPPGADPVDAVLSWTNGRGADAVLLTLATKSDEPVAQAAKMSRQRGRIVLVGVTGLNLSRADFFAKELTFQVSCSYGPGRYDPHYEDEGHDYPVGFVRWTEQRNFEAVVSLLADGRLDPSPLLSHTVPITEAPALYQQIADGEAVLGAVLTYAARGDDSARLARTVQHLPPSPRSAGDAVFGVIGAGNFTSRMLLPLLADLPARLHTIASSGGVSAGQAARKFRFEQSTTDTASIFEDDAVNALLVTTRHDSHADFVCRGLTAGKAVFVEKPLAVTDAQLDRVVEAHEAAPGPLLMVGFNRRFAPLTVKLRTLLQPVREPKALIMTVNAGMIPAEHWVHDVDAGGGRIIGEGCHFIDLLRTLVGHPIVGWSATAMRSGDGLPIGEDKCTFTLRFEDGSFGTVHYLGNGHKGFPKERLEVFAAGKTAQIDNFKTLTTWGWPRSRPGLGLRQDKGHAAGLKAFVEAIRTGGNAPIPFDELVEISRAAIQIGEAARWGGGSGELVLGT